MLFHQLGRPGPGAPYPFVTDLTGQLTWYYDPSQAGLLPDYPAEGSSLVRGGTVLRVGADNYSPLPVSRNVLREIDLAGNPLRETNVAALNEQLTALGHDIIYSFTHDVQRLPNGQTAVIGLTERTVNINGAPTDYIGNMLIVLNADFQVTWAWDGFDHLDVNRGVPVSVVPPGHPGPPAAVPRLPAVDWLHINAVSWSPADGNLVLSINIQSWVTKVDYRNGEGDGHIVWRLGQDGDFTVDSKDPNPWFSHQHNAHYIDNDTLILFDNGNTRRKDDPDAHSRGQVWTLDEQTMTATLVFNADLGNYSGLLGSAQALPNGNYAFTSGAQGEPPNFIGQSIEVRPDGTQAYVLQVDTLLYRSFRVRTLYEGTDDSPNAGGGRGRSADSTHRRSVPFSASDQAVALLGPTAAVLAAPAWQQATPVTPPAATPILASAVPLVPMGGMSADPTSPEVPAVAAVISSTLFADPANDLGYDGLGDDLAWALIA
jgi:hypothetical protein